MIKCDNCGAEMPELHKALEEEETTLNGKSVTVSFFACNECMHRFVIAVDDVETKRNKVRLLELTNEIKKFTGISNTRPLIKKYERLKDRTIIKQNRLIESYINLK